MSVQSTWRDNSIVGFQRVAYPVPGGADQIKRKELEQERKQKRKAGSARGTRIDTSVAHWRKRNNASALMKSMQDKLFVDYCLSCEYGVCIHA